MPLNYLIYIVFVAKHYRLIMVKKDQVQLFYIFLLNFLKHYAQTFPVMHLVQYALHFLSMLFHETPK